MADCSHKLVRMGKEDSILSEHLAFLFIVLSAILGVYCG